MLSNRLMNWKLYKTPSGKKETLKEICLVERKSYTLRQCSTKPWGNASHWKQVFLRDIVGDLLSSSFLTWRDEAGFPSADREHRPVTEASGTRHKHLEFYAILGSLKKKLRHPKWKHKSLFVFISISLICTILYDMRVFLSTYDSVFKCTNTVQIKPQDWKIKKV